MKTLDILANDLDDSEFVEKFTLSVRIISLGVIYGYRNNKQKKYKRKG